MTSTTEYRNIVYRLIPGTTTKAQKLAAQAGACRFVWNTLLGRTQTAYAEALAKGVDGDKGEKPPSVSFFSLGKNFTVLRREVPWLGDYSYAITRYVLKYQADAWVQAFKGGGYPRFKKRGLSIPSFTIPENVRIKENKLYIPRLGWYRLQRKGGNPWVGGMGPDGTPVKAVIRKISADRWHVTICYKVEVPPMQDNGVIAGIDMNVGQVAVVTNREQYFCGQDERGHGKNHQDAPLLIELPRTTGLEVKIKRVQRALARKKKGSNRRQKMRERCMRLMRKRANRRKNWQHHTSQQISQMASTVVVEKFNTQGMTSSAKGTVANPGRNVKAKSGLNREILNTGWAGLQQMLAYKCREVIAINPAWTSQTCHACKQVNKASRKGRHYECVACGHADHADVNAARNILSSGITASGIGATARRGALALATPMTRETDRIGDFVN